jgi:hypothetical protein
MQIEQNLPQFVNEYALLVVTGKQTAELYVAHNGEIEELDTFTVDRTKPDDVAGHFEQSGHGQTFRAGSAHEPSDYDEKAQSEFLKELGRHLEAVADEYTRDAVYVFSPEHLKNQINDVLPHAIRDRIVHQFVGNYTKHHPFELLKGIANEQPASGMTEMGPHEEQAQEILRKTQKE